MKKNYLKSWYSDRKVHIYCTKILNLYQKLLWSFQISPFLPIFNHVYWETKEAGLLDRIWAKPSYSPNKLLPKHECDTLDGHPIHMHKVISLFTMLFGAFCCSLIILGYVYYFKSFILANVIYTVWMKYCLILHFFNLQFWNLSPRPLLQEGKRRIESFPTEYSSKSSEN